MRSAVHSLALLLVLASPIHADAGAPAAALEGLVSRAEVAGPRGAFTTEIVSLADGTARFVQTHPAPRGRIELLVTNGTSAWERDAKGEFVAAKAGTADFVLGHDAPRLAHAAGARPATLALPSSREAGGGTVTIDLGDYRRVAGLDLPFAATFVHSSRPGDRYPYRYVSLLPFRLAPGAPLPSGPAALEALFDRLGDLAALAEAHETVMAAHRASDAAKLVSGAGERSTFSGRGRLSEVRREEQLTRMSGYLGSIRFARYEDTVVPVVAVSSDGSLGWLACEMEAEGTRTADGKSEPIAYAFSWVELYSAAAGGENGRIWRAIGNASSQRP